MNSGAMQGLHRAADSLETRFSAVFRRCLRSFCGSAVLGVEIGPRWYIIMPMGMGAAEWRGWPRQLHMSLVYRWLGSVSVDANRYHDNRGNGQPPVQVRLCNRIETESVPPGLNEDVIRLISAKKGEPEWMLGMAAEGVPALADHGGADLGERALSRRSTTRASSTTRPRSRARTGRRAWTKSTRNC